MTCFMQFFWAETVMFIKEKETNIFFYIGLIDMAGGPGIWSS